MKRKETKKQGFTLVEVIVVAVIVLILSAVAIPMYNGYVMDARRSVVSNLAETAAAAVNSLWRKTGTDPAAGEISPNTSPYNLHFNDDATKGHTVEIKDDGTIVVTENRTGGISSDAVKFK